MINTIQGKDLILMISGTTGYQAVAHATSHSLDIEFETNEISSKSTGGVKIENYSGNYSWTASADALVSFDSSIINYDYFIDKGIANETVKLVSIVKKTTLDDTTETSISGTDFQYTYREGLAIIKSVSLSSSNGDTSTFSISFGAAGGLEKKTVA